MARATGRLRRGRASVSTRSNITSRTSCKRRAWSVAAQLRLWDGIRRDSELFKKEMPVNQDLQMGAIGQIARSVKDIEEASAWYQQVLQLKHLYTFGTLAFFD